MMFLPKCQFCKQPTKFTIAKDSNGGRSVIVCSVCGKHQDISYRKYKMLLFLNFKKR